MYIYLFGYRDSVGALESEMFYLCSEKEVRISVVTTR